MFIIHCECGNEMFCSGEDMGRDFWQCEECGRWYDYFGYEVPVPDPDSPYGY